MAAAAQLLHTVGITHACLCATALLWGNTARDFHSQSHQAQVELAPLAGCRTPRAFAVKPAFESVAVGLERAQTLLPVLQALATSEPVSIDLWRVAAQSSTVFAEAVANVGAAGRSQQWCGVFSEAASLTKAYIEQAALLPPLPGQEPVPLRDDWSQGHYYAPCLRHRRPVVFTAAGGAPGGAVCRVAPKGCTKRVLCSSDFSPGIFVVTCGHGFIYGYSLMRDFESPRTPFELFSNRVACPASTTIVYDNGCHLLSYGLNRFAKFWSQARVLVDCLHYKGHCACSKCFDSSVYTLKDFNSQACEQFNAFLSRAAPSFHQMTSRSCMIWMFSHCMAWNMRLAAREARGTG